MNASIATAPADTALAAMRDVLRCTACRANEFAPADGGLRCGRCGVRFSIEGGIVDGMPNPSKDVIDELRGMMRELKIEGDDYRTLKRLKVPRVSTFAERKQVSIDDGTYYYGSTEQNFQQAMALVPFTGRDRVLEVAGEQEIPFLQPFVEAGCASFATNVYFHYDDAQVRRPWPVRVLGDMHDLPYRDGAFDIVLISGASHHSPNLDRAIGELARVTRPGGTLLVINEPIRGALKHALSGKKIEKGKQDAENRDELVHEYEYSLFEYLQAFRKSGLELKASLFADYYAQRLSASRVEGVRFAGLAKAMARAWQIPLLRRVATGPGLWLGQATIGLQMNVVLRKRG
jgi:SAM-dependent methyltransferase